MPACMRHRNQHPRPPAELASSPLLPAAYGTSANGHDCMPHGCERSWRSGGPSGGLSGEHVLHYAVCDGLLPLPV
eukprot:364150-Chlamydomonas_euryale.AAC.8